MLRQILILCCLMAAAAGQATYYCNQTAATIRDQDFFLVTRRAGESSYPPGLICEFNAESRTGYYFLEIQTFRVSAAVVTISSGGSTLFSGSVLLKVEATLSTPSRSLRVRFDASREWSSLNSGVTIRVREFNSSGCPPNWVTRDGFCHGITSNNGRLNFADSQKACNKMRANLLQKPRLTASVDSFVRSLPSNMRSYYTWIGLTDLTSRFQHYWLDGQSQSRLDVSCVSGGSYSTCYSTERCGTIYDKGNMYTIFMDRCYDTNNFACSMPPGGTDSFYRVPDGSDPNVVYPSVTYSSWIWIAVGVSVGIAVLVGAIFAGVRHYAFAQTAVPVPGSANVVVSTGAVTIRPPTSGPYPAQPQTCPYPQQQQQYGPPPQYNVAVGGGYGNGGFRNY